MDPTLEGSAPEVLILLSGGLDSAACLSFFRQTQRPSVALFVDYGQLAAAQEKQSATAIARYFGVGLLTTEWRGIAAKSQGYVRGRNAFLILAAAMELPETVTTVGLGLHDGTPYADSSLQFVDSMRPVLNLSSERPIEIATPFITWTKGEVFAYFRSIQGPIELTYSCETGRPDPCGACQSCIDRGAIIDQAR